MIEIPEAANLCRQILETCGGRPIARVTAGLNPHKLAWFYGDQKTYGSLLEGQSIKAAAPAGSLVRLETDDAVILFAEGVNLRYHASAAGIPAKHQFLLEFASGSALSASVQMYGGMGAFREGQLDNPYYRVAREKPSPLANAFDRAWFDALAAAPGMDKLSLKAFLATEQRIPGLGNGCLQDILFAAGFLPMRKLGSLDTAQRGKLFEAVKGVLSEMTARGGRDTEKDFLRQPGGYRTTLSAATAGKPCPRCGATVEKKAYMGGSVYFCPRCQA
jgi:formamidopyrimidine-DNA glycosylase